MLEKVNFSANKAGLNSEFPIANPKLRNRVHPTSYQSLEQDGFMPFARVLAQSKTRKVSSKIWTRVADIVSYEDKRLIKRASRLIDL